MTPTPPSSETMTLEQVRDKLRERAELSLPSLVGVPYRDMADAIDAHLSAERREREGYRWVPNRFVEYVIAAAHPEVHPRAIPQLIGRAIEVLDATAPDGE